MAYLRMSANCRWLGLLHSNYDHHKHKNSFEGMWYRTYVCLPIVIGWVYCAAIMTIIKLDLIWRCVTPYLHMSVHFRWLGLLCSNYDHQKNKTSFEDMWRRIYVCLPIVIGWVYCAAVMNINKTRPHLKVCDAVPTYVCQFSLVGVTVQPVWPS